MIDARFTAERLENYPFSLSPPPSILLFLVLSLLSLSCKSRFHAF